MRDFRYLLVTGGAGFIGSNFVHRTRATRPDVHMHILDALTYAANPASVPDDVELTVGTVVDPDAVAGILDSLISLAQSRGDSAANVAVVHFAAESHNDNSLRDPGIFARTNVEGTVVLAEAAAVRGVHLHHISTDEVFGDLALDDPARFTVDTPYNPSSPYSASKASADHFVRAFVRSRGLSATISNCSNNYGQRQHPEKFIPRQITALLTGEKPRLYGEGLNVRDWIHVDDHNDAVWAILDSGQPGETYLIGAEGERSNRQVVADLLEIFGQPADNFVHVTDRPGHDRRYAIDPASMTSLGWSPRFTRFAEGLAATVEWYRDNPQWWGDSRVASESQYAAHEREI